MSWAYFSWARYAHFQSVISLSFSLCWAHLTENVKFIVQRAWDHPFRASWDYLSDNAETISLVRLFFIDPSSWQSENAALDKLTLETITNGYLPIFANVINLQPTEINLKICLFINSSVTGTALTFLTQTCPKERNEKN